MFIVFLGNLTEFKSVFGPNAHDVLTEKFRSHGPLYEITALGMYVYNVLNISSTGTQP